MRPGVQDLSRQPEESPPADDEARPTDRRQTMKMAAAMAVAAALGTRAAKGAAEGAGENQSLPRETAPGDDVMSPPYGRPSIYEAQVASAASAPEAHPTRRARRPSA